ncbi:sac3 ganp domain protein [Pelomyxa schiedti]|nr:sac3 ganp domain protein [Pelomyxa schiedti]
MVQGVTPAAAPATAAATSPATSTAAPLSPAQSPTASPATAAMAAQYQQQLQYQQQQQQQYAAYYNWYYGQQAAAVSQQQQPMVGWPWGAAAQQATTASSSTSTTHTSSTPSPTPAASTGTPAETPPGGETTTPTPAVTTPTNAAQNVTTPSPSTLPNTSPAAPAIVTQPATPDVSQASRSQQFPAQATASLQAYYYQAYGSSPYYQMVLQQPNTQLTPIQLQLLEQKHKAAMRVAITPKIKPDKDKEKEKPANTESKEDSQHFPPKLRAFVERCFQACSTDEQRNETEIQLKHIITDALTKKIMWTRDWDKEPTPTLKAGSTKSTDSQDAATSTPSSPSPSPSKIETFLSRKGMKPFQKLAKQDKIDKPKKKKWETPEETERRKKRKLRFGFDDPDPENSPTTTASKIKDRFNGFYIDKHPSIQIDRSGWGGSSSGVVGFDDVTEAPVVVGTSQSLEKQYLRTTSDIDPASVRPEGVLKQSFKMILQKLRSAATTAAAHTTASTATPAHSTPDYTYICEQLKCIRQDLMVQHIQNVFTVKVYELHARLAMKNNDWGEFNQCQMQLVDLYQVHASHCQHEAEFAAYRVLFTASRRSSTDMTKVIADLSPQLMSAPAVVHALSVVSAVNLNDYCLFFRLLGTVPNHGKYLMNQMIPHMRSQTLLILCKSYNPTLPISMVCQALHFCDSHTEPNREELTACTAFLESEACVIESTFLQTRKSLQLVLEKRQSAESNRMQGIE